MGTVIGLLAFLLLFMGCAAQKPGEKDLPPPLNQFINVTKVPAQRYVPGPRPFSPKYEEIFRWFEKQDRDYPVPPGSIVFIGDERIRRWELLPWDMKKLRVLNRGFDGATMKDVAEAAQWFVVPYKPQMVVVCAGSKDLEKGRSPEEVLVSFDSLVRNLKNSLPDTGIFCLSLISGPGKSWLWEKEKETNHLMERYCSRVKGVNFIDLRPALTSASGKPLDIFFLDGVHLGSRGYSMMTAVIKPVLLASLDYYSPYPEPQFFGKIMKNLPLWITQSDLDALPLLNLPDGIPEYKKEEIKERVEIVFRDEASERDKRKSWERLVEIGYYAVPAVINKIIRLDYSTKRGVEKGRIGFWLLMEMCNGTGLDFHGRVLPESPGPPPWKDPYDINWNRAAAWQWHNFWVRYGDTKEHWEMVLIGFPLF